MAVNFTFVSINAFYLLKTSLMLKRALLVSILSGFSFYGFTQTTYLQLGQEDYDLLDRLETRSGRLTTDFFTTVKPTARKGAVQFLEEKKQAADSIGLTNIDRYNIDHMISVSGEWAADGDGAIDSKLPWFKTFYKKQPDLVHVKTKDFFLVVNPVISGQVLSENYKVGGESKTQTLFSSSRGVELRGWISKKIGFYTYFTDNQEQLPSYVKAWTDMHQAVPGADYYQTPSDKTYDYLLARGYIDFAAVKDHVNVTFGYDKHFIGDGMRSLFLSDFSSGATFLRLSTKIWKLNYQNLYLELTPQYERGADQQLPHKYATIHHLSINATKWLNIGLFESVIFDRTDRYSFDYMIPVIFYRAVERSNGSPDNENMGLNFKAIVAKHFQFYGQLFLDELRTKELFGGKGWWGNKFGIQLGGKYFDAFTVKNLNLQGEINIVRPYTYSHSDTIANYTNYNQPLAHPLGASFAELIGKISYQPVKNLYLTLKGSYYQQSADSGSSNLGSNIFADYDTRTVLNPGDPEHGYKLINGIKATCMNLSLNGSYELRENLFIDLGFSYRKYSYSDSYLPETTSTFFYGGLRLNIARRDYNFY
ncbi:hypothetical protein ACTHGU_17360 [Chitinophagaceae bacterium MMS25-I14]